MIKKLLFSFLAMSAISFTADAVEFDLLPTLGTGGWGSSYDAASQTITIESAWSAGGWWFGDSDFSAYDEMVMEIEPLDYPVYLAITYVEDSDSKSEATADAGTTKIVCLLDADRKNQIQAIWLQSPQAGEIVVRAAYFQSQAPFDPTAPVDFIEESQTLTDWNFFNIKPYDFQVAQLSEGDQICMDYSSENGGAYKIVNPDGWSIYPFFTKTEGYSEENSIAPFEAGDHTVKFTLSADDITALCNKGMTIQGDGATINKVYLQRYGNSSRIETSVGSNDNCPVEYFNIQGVRITNPENGGLYIRRQGNKIEKIIIR